MIYLRSPREKQSLNVKKDGKEFLFKVVSEPTPIAVVPMVLDKTKVVGSIGFSPFYERLVLGVSGPRRLAAGLCSFDYGVGCKEITLLMELECVILAHAGLGPRLEVRSLKADVVWSVYPFLEQFKAPR